MDQEMQDYQAMQKWLKGDKPPAQGRTWRRTVHSVAKKLGKPDKPPAPVQLWRGVSDEAAMPNATTAQTSGVASDIGWIADRAGRFLLPVGILNLGLTWILRALEPGVVMTGRAGIPMEPIADLAHVLLSVTHMTSLIVAPLSVSLLVLSYLML
jgi:hypothetical protein